MICSDVEVRLGLCERQKQVLEIKDVLKLGAFLAIDFM